jgi:hypothetical protein
MKLSTFLKNADERVKKACADALNEASKELEQQIEANMSAVGITSRSGKLRGSIKSTVATPERPRVVVKSEVYANLPKRANKNRRLWGKSAIRYAPRGVPYGRILEFSPRYNRPFFYKAWYARRKQIKEDIIQIIGNAWSGK